MTTSTPGGGAKSSRRKRWTRVGSIQALSSSETSVSGGFPRNRNTASCWTTRWASIGAHGSAVSRPPIATGALNGMLAKTLEGVSGRGKARVSASMRATFGTSPGRSRSRRARTRSFSIASTWRNLPANVSVMTPMPGPISTTRSSGPTADRARSRSTRQRLRRKVWTEAMRRRSADFGSLPSATRVTQKRRTAVRRVRCLRSPGSNGEGRTGNPSGDAGSGLPSPDPRQVSA